MFILTAILGLVVGTVIGAFIGAVAGIIIGLLGRLFFPITVVMTTLDNISGNFWLSHLWLIFILAGVGAAIGGIFGIICGFSSGSN